MPPPVAEPTHWFRVAFVRESAPGVSALMLFVTVTSQVISGGAASLPEPLHWVTFMTRSEELVENVPFPGGHGPSKQFLVTVRVELVMPLLIVLTTVTVQVSPVVAPRGPPLRPLHWSTVRFAARAAGGSNRPAMENAEVRTITAITAVSRVNRYAERRAGAM